MNRQQKVKYSAKEQKINFVNGIVHLHDLTCGCDGPLEHTILNIVDQEKNLRFTPEEKTKIQKWLTDTTDAATTTQEDDYGDVNLEDLFTEDFGEKDDTTADTG